jgi:hypothetical protein
MIPAVYATSPSPDVSDRYKFVPTIEYVHALENQGWQMESAKAPKARKSDPAFGLHSVTFRRADFDNAGTQALGGLVPRIHLLNSHDGTSKTQIMLGILRLVCTNGLMVSSGEIASIAFRHDRSAKDTATVLSQLFQSDAMGAIEKASAWDSIELSQDSRIEFATKVRNLRFGADSTVDPMSLLMVRRNVDVGNSLWRTMNVLQENVMQGGVRFYGMRRRSRPVTNISKEVELNKSLWSIAESYATA